MPEGPCNKRDYMTAYAIGAEPVGYVTRGRRILCLMAGVAVLRDIPVKPVLMTRLTVSRAVPAEERKACRVMFKLRGSP